MNERDTVYHSRSLSKEKCAGDAREKEISNEVKCAQVPMTRAAVQGPADFKSKPASHQVMSTSMLRIKQIYVDVETPPWR